jgi:hypothetical protein
MEQVGNRIDGATNKVAMGLKVNNICKVEQLALTCSLVVRGNEGQKVKRAAVRKRMNSLTMMGVG